jgi:hypothetical protein
VKYLLPLVLLFCACKPTGDVQILAVQSYDQMVAVDHPVLYLRMAEPLSGLEGDVATGNLFASYVPSSAQTTCMPNGDQAALFNGVGQYLEFPNQDYLSVSKTGVLTIEAWVRPSMLEFPDVEGSGYVYLMGKGEPNQHEYALRMYSTTNNESPVRPNRVSGYVFNLTGGLGAGSYWQPKETDPILIGNWIHVVLVINSVNMSPDFLAGYTILYKDGKKRDMDGLEQYNIIPQAGTAPFRIGTRNSQSYFAGAIGKVAIYDYELTQGQIEEHYNRMFQ